MILRLAAALPLRLTRAMDLLPDVLALVLRAGLVSPLRPLIPWIFALGNP